MQNLFIIGYGLSGGFGGARNFEVVEAESIEQAEHKAWELACEEYEQYCGMHGMRSLDEIKEQEGLDNDEDAKDTYNEERESWLDYCASNYSKEEEEKVKHFNYENNFKDRTDKL